MPSAVFDSLGQQVPLGRILGSGGEGEVFEVARHPDNVAKLYKKPVSHEKARKLEVMTSLKTDALLKLTAWPKQTLYNSQKHVCGFIMPNVSGHKDIHYLYSPKSRRDEFPKASYRFLVHTSANVARAFATVHSTGSIIGDVNHGGITVAADGTVKLIDCDSFQITSKGERFFCEVGVPTFTPPELQGLSSFRGVTRTSNHDNFGLAVLIFHMLFMGRHPFAGVPLSAEDMPIEKAIREFRFPYSISNPRVNMKPPPNALLLTQVPSEIAGMFEIAFSSNGASTTGRPNAASWVTALEALQKGCKKCSVDGSHEFPASLASCPWCAIEANSRVPLFGTITAPGPQPIGLDPNVWAAKVMGVAPPPAVAMPDIASIPQVKTVSAALERSREKNQTNNNAAIGWGIAAIFLGGLFAQSSAIAAFWGFIIPALIAWGSRGRKNTFAVKGFAEQERNKAQAEVSRLQARWTAEADSSVFQRKRQQVMVFVESLRELPTYRTKLLANLESKRREAQLEAYLDTFKIERAKIDKIGAGRKATLASFGIETAADINERALYKIPKFGPSLVGNLMNWRRQCSARFVFNASKGVDPAAIAGVERDVLKRRQEIEQKIKTGIVELQKVKQSMAVSQESLKGVLMNALSVLAQAQYDLSQCN